MAGALVGQANRAGRVLHAAGLSRTAVWSYGVVAELVRAEDRIGPVSVAAVACATVSSERTASRCLAALRAVGLITMVRRGGGRGRGGMPALYRVVDLGQWLAARNVDVAVAGQSGPAAQQDPHGGGSITHDPTHDGPDGAAGGGSITTPGPDLPDPPATGGGPIHGPGRHDSDPPAISGRSTRHPGGALPVLPGRTPGETPEVTTGRERPATHPTPAASIDPPPWPAPPAPGPGESWCRQPGCPAPGPCRPCGRARQAAEQQHTQLTAASAAAAVAAADAARARELAARDARRAAALTCPNACRDGYDGLRVCDHQPRPDHTQLRGYQLCRRVLGELALPTGRRPARSPARSGRHAVAA